MADCPRPPRRFTVVGIACGAASTGIACIALAGWVANRLALARLAAMSIPMAPATALVVVLMDSGLLMLLGTSRRGAARAAAAAAAMLAALILAQFVGGFDAGVERMLARPVGPTIPGAIGQMSPITAGLCLLAALGVMSLATRIRVLSLPGCVGAIVSAISFVMLMGYAYGTPLLYGSSIIPVALPTAAALFLTGIAVVTGAGPTAWPTRSLSGQSVNARFLRALLPAILLLLLLDAWADAAVLRREVPNPALAQALKAIVSIAVFSAAVTLIARRTSRAIDAAHAALHASEVRYRVVTETASDAIVSVDAQDRIVLWNPAAERMFGYLAAEILERPLTTIMPDRFRANHLAGVTRRLAGGLAPRMTEGTVVVTGLKKGGEELPLELSLAGSAGVGATAILRDMTARRLAEAEREQLIAHLQRALADVKTLSGIIPICAACKKIRDDEGYWHAVEAYVRDHTGAEFSHGVCPACSARLYPNFQEDCQSDGLEPD
jgi:PAS domain S-box-containing protein